MSVLAARATGNLTTAATWGLVDSTSYSNSETLSVVATTSYQQSSAFTPGAITIDGIAIKLAARDGTTGTISVSLAQAGVTVAGTEVTINCSDLPNAASATVDGGWVLFAFASKLLTGATAYTVQVKTSSAAQVHVWCTATTNWSRALRTTTTQAPVAGDDLIVAGGWTAAATQSAFVVTNDQTANTNYGSNTTSTVTPAISICNGGTLKFKDTSAANPYLRVSGHLIVYNGGTFNIGTSGTPIPRDSIAILEFNCAADGDFGLVARNGSTCNLQGLSRTSGKNVVSCKLAADSSTNLMQTQNITASALTVSAATTTLDPTGTSLGVGATLGTFNQLLGCVDTVANANHKATWQTAGSVTNVTQVYTQWIKRGSGTNNRFVRLQLATATALPATNGFFADFDLQAGTAGTCTALGNGTATSASITAFGGGFICTIIGKISSGASPAIACIGACSASGTVSYAGDATQNFIINWPQVYTASAQPTQDTVDTDTGWLSGDVVALASTTRTANECEVASLNGNAGATTLTYSLYPVNARSGTSPTQAEVILLTRNVKVRGVSTTGTGMTFVDFQDNSVVSVDWVEFYNIGANVTGKRGIEARWVGTSTSINVSITHSSIHDSKNLGLALLSGATSAITTCLIQNNVMWNLATTLGPGCQTTAVIFTTNYTIDSNILIRTGNGNGWTLSDVGGTFTNNTVVGAASAGIGLAEASMCGVMTGNIAHSNTSNGHLFTGVGISGVYGTATAWRNNSPGIQWSAFAYDMVLDTPVCFGNATANITASLQVQVQIKSPTLNGDTTFSTADGLRVGSSTLHEIVIDNGDFSTVSGIKTTHTNDINLTTAGVDAKIVLRNTKLGAATQVATPTNLSNNGYVSAEKLGQTSGNHKTWMRNGAVMTDSVIYNTTSPSMQMAPTAQGTFTGAVTSGSAVIAVAAASLGILPTLAAGDLLVGVVAAFPLGTKINSISVPAGTITMSANAGATTAVDTISYCKKLESAPKFEGMLVAVANGATAAVSAYVIKRAENLFTYSQDYSQVAWLSNASTPTTGQSDSQGGTTATKFLETTTNSNSHGLNRATAVVIVNGATYTVAFDVQAVGRQWVRFIENSRSTWLDLTNGVSGTVNAAHTVNSVTSLGSGWYRVSITIVSNTASDGPSLYTSTANNDISAFVGDITKGLVTGRWQIEAGSAASPYQLTTASNQPGYNGQQPRLIQKANPALGQNSDVVLGTYASGNGVWAQISGATSSPTDDGAFEIVVDCDGTQGAINVDDFAVS